MAVGKLILEASHRLVSSLGGLLFPWSIFITRVIKVLSLCIGFTVLVKYYSQIHYCVASYPVGETGYEAK